MRPFNLKEAEAGKAVCTSEGLPVTLLKTDLLNREFCIVGYYTCTPPGHPLYETLERWTAQGVPLDTLSPHLRMVVTKEKRWVNVYKSDTSVGFGTGGLYMSREDALEMVGEEDPNYVTTSFIEWEE